MNYGANIVIPGNRGIDEIAILIRQRVKGIELPFDLGTSLLKTPSATVRDIDGIELSGRSPNIIVLVPWEVLKKVHYLVNLGTAGSNYSSLREPPDDLGYFLRSKN